LREEDGEIEKIKENKKYKGCAGVKMQTGLSPFF
jgi:hypothetical protein